MATPAQVSLVAAALAAAACAVPGRAGDLPPALVARFTREVQPLLLNRCAAGACHGGAKGHAPTFHRGDVRGAVSSEDTLANAATFRGLLGPTGDPRPLVMRLSTRHPATTTSRTLVMRELSPRERAMLEGWLVDATVAAGRPPVRDAAVAPASHAEPAAPAPTNRLRTLLDTGLPPPSSPGRPPAEGTTFTGIVDLRKAPAATRVTPGSDPPSPPPGTADSLPARPDDPASPGPTATGSR